MTLEEIILFGIIIVCMYFLIGGKFESNKTLKNIVFTIFLIDGYFLLIFGILVPSESILKRPGFINYLTSLFFILMALMITIMIWKFGKILMEENQLSRITMHLCTLMMKPSVLKNGTNLLSIFFIILLVEV